MAIDLRVPVDGTHWTTQDEGCRLEFARLVERIESHSLARLALQVAVSEYRELIVEAILAKLEELTKTVAAKLPEAPTDLETIHAINERLFGDLKFWGDQNQPDDPRNSYLNDVLKRRVGLPTALCVVYVAVAERLGLSLHVVAIPGLHLVRHRINSLEDLFIDVYHGGDVLGHAELADLVGKMTGGRYEWGATRPEDVGNREVLTGLLTDLKGAYARRADGRRMLRVQHYLLTLNPDASRELRVRGRIFERLGASADALGDYRQYLAEEPDAADRDQILHRIEHLE